MIARTGTPVTASFDEPVLDAWIPSGEGWAAVIPAGARVRIVDVEGNQAADTLLLDAHDHAERYSAFDTVAAQGRCYLGTGSRLLSQRGNLLATITDDTCGRHDTIGGACAQESNVVRYGTHTRHEHACRENFVAAGAAVGVSTADLTHNINFFMNVPVTDDGGLTFADGVSSPGAYVELQTAREIVLLISNCPQLNNPCNGWNPTALRVLGVW